MMKNSSTRFTVLILNKYDEAMTAVILLNGVIELGCALLKWLYIPLMSSDEGNGSLVSSWSHVRRTLSGIGPDIVKTVFLITLLVAVECLSRLHRSVIT